jgi:hypothetical protein
MELGIKSGETRKKQTEQNEKKHRWKELGELRMIGLGRALSIDKGSPK